MNLFSTRSIRTSRETRPFFSWIRLVAFLSLLTDLSPAFSGESDIRRVRVPANRAGGLFPPGTDVTSLPAKDFDELARRAHEGRRRRERAERGPRLVRARHFAVWRNGVLIGRSEFTVDRSEGQSAVLPIEPWSPAARPPQSGDSPKIRTTADGRTALWVESSGTSTVTIDWTLRGREAGEGRAFSLALPKTDVSSLRLDLPAHLMVEGPIGVRQGPTRGATPDRNVWRFDGPGGAILLRLIDRTRLDPHEGGKKFWVGGSTFIDLDDSSARWRAEWSVESARGRSRTFAAKLDPGLDLLDVAGPGVVSFRGEPEKSGGTLLTVRLADDAPSPTNLIIRCRTRAPMEGRWSLPSARPLETSWTGGETIARLGPSRVIDDCREAAGRRVDPRPFDADPTARGLTLVFECSRPGSAALLSFRKSDAGAVADVRGIARLNQGASKLETRLTWRVARGRLLDAVVDLAPGWTPERLIDEKGTEPVSWHAVDRGKGRGIRVMIRFGVPVEPGNATVLTLFASTLARNDRIELPRVLPVGVGIGEEAWLARVDRTKTLRPIDPKGLAWIDPAFFAPDDFNEKAEVDIHGTVAVALAWRWTTPDGSAKARIEPLLKPAEARVFEKATFSRERLAIDARIELEPGLDEPSPARLTIESSEPISGDWQWRFGDESIGPLLIARKVGKSAWEAELPRGPRGLIVLNGRARLAWKGRGELPLIGVSKPCRTVGTVLIESPAEIGVEAKGDNLRRLDPNLTRRTIDAVRDESLSARPRGVSLPRSAFGYSSGTERLSLQTKILESAIAPGLIREAAATTFVAAPGLPIRERLVIRAVALIEPTLTVKLPRTARLDRASVDGTDSRGVERRDRSFEFSFEEIPNGSREHCIILEYIYSCGHDGSIGEDSPSFSWPCLTFSRDLSTWGSRRFESKNPGVFHAPPDADEKRGRAFLGDWGSGRFGIRGDGFDPLGDPRAKADEIAMRAGDGTLGDFLMRADSGRLPIVVDRAALEEIGVGPSSRFATFRFAKDDPPASRNAGSPTDRLLKPFQATMIPVGGALVVTSKLEGRGLIELEKSAPRGLASLFKSAVGRGSDETDRYQRVSVWRREASPLSKTFQPNRPPVLESSRRFAAVGPPASASRLFESTETRASRLAWAVSLATFATGFACRSRFGSRLKGIFLTVGFTLGVLIAAWNAPRISVWGTGLTRGIAFVAALWLGGALRPRRDSIDRARVHPTLGSGRRSTMSSALGAGAIALAAGSFLPAAAEDGKIASRILVLIPYQGSAPAPDDPGDQAIVRTADLESLRADADWKPSPSPFDLTASAAAHRVRFSNAEEKVLIESRLDLHNESNQPIDWIFPLGDSIDTEALLDGRHVPVLVRAGGKSAAVSIAGEGRHELIVRRGLAIEPFDDRNPTAPWIDLPINPVPAATWIVEADRNDARRLEALDARGESRRVENERIEALGPIARLAIRAGLLREVPKTRGIVDATILWDALPAGDRARAKLVVRDPEGTRLIRLALGSGVVVRSAEAKGLVESGRYQDIWTARFDPPLADRDALTIELWRPRADGDDARGDELRQSPARRLPAFSPIGATRFEGLIGFRRPGDWWGRLGAFPEGKGIAEEDFSRAWGEFPRDRLVLAGAARFASKPEAEVMIGPLPARRFLSQRVQVQIVPGRLDVRIEATLTEREGRSFETEVELPETFQILEVEADGLTNWSRDRSGRLRLRFDGPAAERRTIRIVGKQAVESDPAATVSTPLEAVVPWPKWPGIDVEPGTLAVFSNLPARLDELPGVETLERGSRSGSATGGPSATRSVYRISRTEGPGILRWSSEPNWIDAVVTGKLTIHPDIVEWTAILRARVSRGSCEALRVRLPTAWAESARIEWNGVDRFRRLERRRGASTVWTIRPDRPIWGTRELILRAVRTLPKGEPLETPRLEPLGWGSVETYLILADASGRAEPLTNSSGLQPIPLSRLPGEDRPARTAGQPPTLAWLVKQDGWSLKIPPLPRSSGVEGTDSDESRVEFADVRCSIAEDGTVLGQARYELDSKPGSSLTIVLPRGGEALAADVDGASVRPILKEKNRWVVAIDRDRRPKQVGFLWRSKAEPGDRGVFEAPGLSAKKVRTLLTVDLPENFRVQPLSVESKSCSLAELEIERLEHQTVKLAEKTSGDPSALAIDGFIDWELLARDADRAIARIEPSPRTPAEIQARNALAARLNNARLNFETWAEGNVARREVLRQAKARIGLIADRSSPAPANSTEVEPIFSALQPRRIGRPVGFLAETAGHGLGLPLEWTQEPSNRAAGNLRLPLASAICLVFSSIVWFAAKMEKRPVRLGLAAIIAVAPAPFYAPVEWPTVAAWLLAVVSGRLLKR